MAATAADRMVECLLEWGVDTVFGLPGDGINGIMESLRQCQERIRFVQVRHEETAALMACGYAKLTGRLGVCLATSGPGGIHLLNGLYDAKLDGAAVLAITGLQYHDLVHTHTQQDVELDKLFMDVAVYNAIKEYAADPAGFKTGYNQNYTVKNGGVGYGRLSVKLPKPVAKAYTASTNALAKLIASGKVQVPSGE